MKKSEISYCGELVRKYDADKFLLSMFAPADVREDLWALFAFNHEIAKTREVVSDATLGLIRLQWWRDEIAKIYEGEGACYHEVLKPLSVAIARHDLSLEHFDRLIYAREFDLQGVALADIDGLVNYADYTTTPLLSLVAYIVSSDDVAHDVVRAAAVNFALAGIIRSSSSNQRQGFYLLPTGVSISDIIDVESDCLRSSNIMINGFAVLSDIYFKQIKAVNYDIMSIKLQRDPAFKALRLFWRVKILYN